MEVDVASNVVATQPLVQTPPAVLKKEKRSKKLWELKTEQPHITQTIKCRLQCKEPVKTWLRSSVDVVSKIAVHVSRFSNMYVLYCCENSLPLPEIDQRFFNNIRVLVTNAEQTSFPDKQLKMVYNKIYKPLLGKTEITRDTEQGRFLETLSHEMETNARVYLKTQFIIRFRKWCQDCVTDIIPLDDSDPQVVEKKKQRWKIVSYLFQETAKSDSRNLDYNTIFDEAIENLSRDCALIWDEDIIAQVALAIQSTRMELDTEITTKEGKTVYCRTITGSKLLRTDLNHCYTKWMYKRLVELEQHNSNPNNKQKKVFSLLPIRSLDRCYITVSNTALIGWIYSNRHNRDIVGEEIYEKVKHLTDKKDREDWEKVIFYLQPLWYWKQCFDLEQFKFTTESQIVGKSQFFGTISTDGYGCSIVTKKIVREKQKSTHCDGAEITLQDDERKKDQEIKLLSAEQLQDADIVGVDPGRKTLYTSAFERKGENHLITSYSAGRWRHESGGNKAKLKREMLAKRMGNEYNNWLLQMPSCKVATVEAMQTHVKHLMLRFHQCFELNGKTSVKELRFNNYMYKQKALAKMVDEFVNQCKSEKKKLIVAFGDASFKTSGPVKKMKQELKRRKNVTLINMDEFHTTLMMTCCAFHADGSHATERTSPLVKHKDKEGIETELRSDRISYCKKCTCYWNRDVNAAVNMLRVFQHAQQHGGERHKVFSRGVPTSKKQKRTADKREDQLVRSAKKSKNVGLQKHPTSLSDLLVEVISGEGNKRVL